MLSGCNTFEKDTAQIRGKFSWRYPPISEQALIDQRRGQTQKGAQHHIGWHAGVKFAGCLSGLQQRAHFGHQPVPNLVNALVPLIPDLMPTLVPLVEETLYLWILF